VIVVVLVWLVEQIFTLVDAVQEVYSVCRKDQMEKLAAI
jgi:hypothetical protein